MRKTGIKTEPKNQSKSNKAQETISELNQPRWAVTDGIECFGRDLTYRQAVDMMFELPDNSVIVTLEAAQRLSQLTF